MKTRNFFNPRHDSGQWNAGINPIPGKCIGETLPSNTQRTGGSNLEKVNLGSASRIRNTEKEASYQTLCTCSTPPGLLQLLNLEAKILSGD